MKAQRFLWLYDQLTEQEMSGMQVAILFIILARDEAGMRPATKAELGHLIGVTERHAATILKELQYDLNLILARKGEKAGKGRAPNRYVPRPDSTGAAIPDDWVLNCKTGTTVHEKTDKATAASADSVVSRKSKTGTAVQEACGEPRAPMNRNAGARAAPDKITTQVSKLNPERSVCVARAMPIGPGDLDLAWTLGDDDRAFAGERGYLNGSCDELFGQFLDHCATKGPRQSAHWRSEWRKWVRNQVRFDTERVKRANPSEANNVSTTGTPTTTIRGERISKLTAARRQRQAERDAEREPIVLGRVESERIP